MIVSFLSQSVSCILLDHLRRLSLLRPRAVLIASFGIQGNTAFLTIY